LMYSLDAGVVMTGKLTNDETCAPINPIGKFWKPWFFTHVQQFLASTKPSKELIPLRDYYHRHSRSIFWEIQDIIPFGNNVVFRHLLGWMVPPKIALLKLTTTEALNKLYTEKHVVQDMLVPIKSLSESLQLFHKEFELYPLWLCPMRIPDQRKTLTVNVKDGDEKLQGDIVNGFVKPLADDEMFIDIGAYGNPKPPDWNSKESLRRIEKFVRDVKGFQALYADTYMTRQEFREMFDHRLYDLLREKYRCGDAFPEVYDKISKKARK